MQQLYTHWRELTYFDNESSVFPEQDILDELQLHDPIARGYVKKAFETLLEDFNEHIHNLGIYDYFYSQGYVKIMMSKKDYATFI